MTVIIWLPCCGFYRFWSYWCLRVKYHMFLDFQKFFFTESRKFLCDYDIFSPKYAIFYIYFTAKYPSILAKIFWTRKSKENLRNSIHHSFNLYTLQPNTNIDSPLQVRSPRKGPWRVANQSLEVHCSSIIFPPNPKTICFTSEKIFFCSYWKHYQKRRWVSSISSKRRWVSSVKWKQKVSVKWQVEKGECQVTSGKTRWVSSNEGKKVTVK